MGGGNLLNWFAGNGSYMRLADCMAGDTFWIVLTIVLDVAVLIGYLIIASHWWRNERRLRESVAKSALRNMKRIFIFCGLCGYLFIPIKMIWPAWRLYDFTLMALAYFTWRYVFEAQELRVVYEELDRTAQLTKELESSREEARKKSLFLSSISHDLRTPLNGLVLHAELAEMSAGAGDSEALRESLVEIQSCVRSTAVLLEEFLELGRLDWSGRGLKPEDVIVTAIIARVFDANRAFALRRGLSIEADATSELTIRTDRRILERILQNLVENGLKYTEVGGVRLLAVDESPSIAFHVVDTGIGIAIEHRDLIFQEFFQVNNGERDRTKGFGLGLSIAARMARQLGGELSVRGEPGGGTRFILRLPARVPEGPARGPGFSDVSIPIQPDRSPTALAH